MEKQELMSLLGELVGCTVLDAHKPDKIPRGRWRRERVIVKTIGKALGIEFSDEEADGIMGG